MANAAEVAKGPMSGVRKAAVLLISMPPELSAKLLAQLPRHDVELVATEIARMETVDNELRDRIFREFYNLNVGQKFIDEGGLEHARRLLLKTLPETDAKAAIHTLEVSVRPAPFKFLERAEMENLLTFIQDEHPQTIALIMAHLRPEQAAVLLSGLPRGRKQVEVMTRLAKLDQISPEVIHSVEEALRRKLSDVITQQYSKSGGVNMAAKVLTSVKSQVEKGIMELLEEEDPDLAKSIQDNMFVFEDLLRIDDRGVQTLLREVSNDDLALALRTASEELKAHIFKNMSARAADMIQQDMEYAGPVRVSDVEAAQHNVIEVVRRLQADNTITISGRGESDAYV
ncbi:MAG: flagellar motor switch protein FliG [Planctomycetota bacterium]|nr:flagellar motor switch protein FliG [Planctomycetota bacterium]GIK51992.1 MAG: flagellar motor switch protein FliG [Planctomycetota bacterium]